MIEELARHRCTDADGLPRFVIEQCHLFTTQSDTGTCRRRGAGWVALLDGEPVRTLNDRTFEIIATGERLDHDIDRCDCAPAARVTGRGPTTALS